MNDKQLILAFLIDWLNWAESENPDNRYNSSAGLCFASTQFEIKNNIGDYIVCFGLIDLFKSQRLNRFFPFGYKRYKKLEELGTQHTCPVRLAWVKDTIKALQK